MSTSSDPSAALAAEAHFELVLDQLGRACRCSSELIVTLVQEGVLQPADATAPQWRFDADALRRARTATRLMQDLQVNLAGAALALDLLDRIDALERRLAAGSSGA